MRSRAIAITTNNNSPPAPPRRRGRSHQTRYGGAGTPSGDQVADIECERDCSRDHPIFEHDVVEPLTRKRCVGLGHDASRLAASCLCSVVLASHSSPTETVLRCWAT